MAFDEPKVKGEYFKPADHANAWAILIEVKRDAPNSRNNFGETKDAVYGTITVFATEDDLAEGASPKVYVNERIDAPLLQRELRDNVGIGNETVRVLARYGDRKMWVWRYTSADVRKKVVDWFDAREAAFAAAADEIPEWMK